MEMLFDVLYLGTCVILGDIMAKWLLKKPLVITAVLNDEELIKRVARQCGEGFMPWEEPVAFSESVIRTFIMEYRGCSFKGETNAKSAHP
jgi:hypothetical protein